MNFLRAFPIIALLAITTTSPGWSNVASRGIDYAVRDYNFFAEKNFPDHLIFVCRTGKTAVILPVTPEQPVFVQGVDDGKLWLAAVPRDMVKTLGGEEKLAKVISGNRIDGVVYSREYNCNNYSSYGGRSPTNYEIQSIDNTGIEIKQLSNADANKRLQKGSGSSSSSEEELSVLTIGDNNEEGSSPWTGSRLRWQLAAVATACAFALGGVLVARRWFSPPAQSREP